MNDFAKAAELMKGSALSPFEAAAEELKRRQAGQVGMVLAYDERDPDEAARNAVIGRDLGVSPLLVDAEPEAYDLRLRMQKAAETLRNAPKTAAWLSDMGNGVLAKDDLDNLSWFERGLHGFADLGEATALSRAISRGVQRTKAVRPQISAMSSAGLAADIGRTVDDLYTEELQRIGPAPHAPVQEAIAREAAQARFDMASQFTAEDRDRFVREGAAQLARAAEVMGQVADTAMSPQATTFRDKTLAEAPNTLLGVLGAFAKDPVGGTFFVGETAAEFIPALIASSAVTAVTRSPAAGAIFMGGASAMTENTSSAMEFLAEQGVSLATPEEAMAVIQNADLMRAAQERGLTRGGIIGVMDAISGGVAGKTLAKSPIGDVILQGIAQVGFGAGGEALAQVGAGQQVSWKDIVIEGLAELATAPIEVLGVGGRRLLRSSVKAVKAGDTAAALADVDLQAMASKLRARAPDKFMAALEAQGLGDKAVYVPADALKEYFQAKDVALDEETMRAWGIDPMTFDEAAQSGNDVAIPMANYATHIAGTDAAAWIAENATSDPEEMSLATVKAFNASVQDIMQEAYDQAERARLADEELRASDVQIYDQMFSQLRAAGRSPDVAQNEARIWSAFWRTMGERYGEDPLDLARSMGVQVRGPQSPEFRRRDALDIALNTLRTKGTKALQPRGMSLAEFVKSKGGIQDTGGDVAAMEPPKGVVAETSKEIRARQSQPTLDAMPVTGKGMSLEDMGRMAAEAGYFPDLMGEVNAETNKGEATDFAARLLEALSEDVAGRKVYVEGEGPDADLQALSDALNERGIDLVAMSNDEVAAALDATDGQTYNQDGTLKTDTPEFRAWFGDSKVVDENGEPLVVYHGTRAGGFDRFNVEGRGKTSGTGAFFTESIRGASTYSNRHGTIVPMDEGKVLDDPDAYGFDVVKDGAEWIATAPDGSDWVSQDRDQAIIEAAKNYISHMPDVEGNYAVYLSLQNPLVVDVEGANWNGIGGSNDYFVQNQDGEVVEYFTNREDADSFVAINEDDLGPLDVIEERNNEDAASTDDIARQAREDGYDGVIFENITDEGPFGQGYGWDNKVFVAFRPEQIKSVSNRGTFDPNDPRILYQPGKRGKITLPSGGIENGRTVIDLFETADLSSFLHESGHFFLEAFHALASKPNAPQAMKDDMATILDWFGVKDWSEVGVKQHEQWARGFEAYAMEGKAPSLGLADAFSRFKAWLTRIYRSLAGLNVKITPEIRGVMDRMLATDAEIAEARAEMEMRPLFASAPPGMSEGDFTTYQRMARRATETAEQALLEKTMAKVRREKEAWYRDEKQATRAEVATEYDRRREYRLIDMLANQLWHGLDENGEARTVPDVQIDRKMLVDQFGDGVLAEISRNRFGGKRAIYGDNGSSPEEVAQFFGFASASEMISILQNTPKKRDAVAMETERRMTERHGDPLNDGSIEEEALAAIHNEQQANTVVAEARHMARQLGRPVNGMTAKLYRQRARAMIGRMAVRDAIRVERFLASERKAARAAQDAFAKVARGTKAEAALAEALQAKEQQILNGFLYDEARQIAAEVQRGREKMRSYDKKSVREKLEGGYIEQIDAILADYDFRVRSQLQIARAESLKAFVDRMIEEGREGDLHIDMRLMDEAHRKHYTRLSVDDLRGLFDTIDNIDHLGRFKQKLIDRKRRRDLAESASRVAGQVRENIGAGKAGEKSRLAAAFNLLWRTDTLLARMDGGQEIGPAYDEIKRGIDEAVSEEQAMHVDMAKRLDGLFKEHYSAADLRKMKVERDIPGGNGRAWSKMEILAVALNTGNEDNFARLTANDAAIRNRLTREHVDAILATIDENDWRFVQGMWDMVNSYWPGLAEVAKRRTGVAPKKVEAKLMVNAPAFVTGGYFPIKYDPELSAAAATDEASGWDKFTATGRGATAAVRNGMTMQRQKTGNGRTLRLDMSVAFAHMRDTIRYIALSEAVDNTYRLVSHPDVVNAFLDAGAKDQHTILRLWLKDVASGPAPSSDALNTASRILKNNFTLSRLALNFKTVALQVTGVGQSAVVIGKRNMIRGYMEYLQNPYGTAQSVVEKSAFMKERQSTFQKDIYDFMDDTQIAGPLSSGYKKAKSVLAKIGFAPIVWTQFWAVDMPTWLGAFRTGIETYGDEAKAIHFADRMVARAQDSGLMADRAAFERGTLSESVRQSDFVRLFTTLGGYMLTKMNRAYVLSMQTKADFRSADTGAQKVAIALSAATDAALLYVTEAVLVALVFAAMSDDEDDEDVAKFLLRETGSAVVGGMPLIRDAYAGLMGYGGGGIYGSLAEAPANFIRQVAQGENDAALRRSIADMIGMVTGLPTTGPMRAIEGALDEDVPLSEAVFGRNPLGR